MKAAYQQTRGLLPIDNMFCANLLDSSGPADEGKALRLSLQIELAARSSHVA